MLQKNGIFLLLYLLMNIIFISCCSSEGNMQKKEEISSDSLAYINHIPLPPAAANIKAEILNIQDENETLVCEIKIIEVFEYGPSTPLLGVDSEIKLYITKDFIKEDSKKISEKNLISAQIFFTEPMGGKGYWTLVKFIN